MSKIAIVNSSSFGKYFPEQEERLRKIGQIDHFKFASDISGKELGSALKDYEYIIASVSPYFGPDFFETQPLCKLISRHGIGYNNIDLASATQYGVYISKVGAVVEQDAVAENAIALLMASLRKVVEASAAVKAGDWATRASFLGYQVRNKTVGIIGFGNIGSRVGSILKDGFNCNILAYDPYTDAETLKTRGAQSVDLETLLRESDIISLNAFVDAQSHHLLSAAQFALMKQNVVLINTARGELIEPKALLEALESKKIFAYGADVVEGEPITQDHPLLKFSNVLITPHTSAYTYECLQGMGDKVVSDVEFVAQGMPPLGLINTELNK
jgi:phosphoglycerate dehydrogenase-like enzyme